MLLEELRDRACNLAENMSTDLHYCLAFATAVFTLLMFFLLITIITQSNNSQCVQTANLNRLETIISPPTEKYVFLDNLEAVDLFDYASYQLHHFAEKCSSYHVIIG